MAWRDWAGQLMGQSAPAMTRSRVRAAYGVAITADVLQFALGPLGWVFADEILDVLTMLAVSGLIGFHPLLLPTFVIEFLPVTDVLPTWTGCVALVVSMRRKQAPQPATGETPITIDVKPTKVS
jgi:hypothetical protein